MNTEQMTDEEIKEIIHACDGYWEAVYQQLSMEDMSALAKELDGRFIGDELSPELEQEAKEKNLVVIFGASDDLMELRGAINEELDMYEGGIALLHDGTAERIDSTHHDNREIMALWCHGEGENYADWSYQTNLPHAEFHIYDPDNKNTVYCRGIIIRLGDIR